MKVCIHGVQDRIYLKFAHVPGQKCSHLSTNLWTSSTTSLPRRCKLEILAILTLLTLLIWFAART